MRDPFGFISYRVGPAPSVIISTVWWSLAIILVVTVGVQAGTQAWTALQTALGRGTNQKSAMKSDTGTYQVEEALTEDDGSLSTFEATPYETSDADSGLSGSGLPPMPAQDGPVPVAK